ncbi:hypothetical protein, partial [Bradyrhizobium sp.]|uniref:hypothetical protein n=1 Tax=Bradyrhizobium sp. TaxID=376 RepID=UPI003C6F14B2
MANPYSAWVVKAMVFTVPPVAVALKPETKLREVRLPLRTFVPLNEAPLTASVSCWPSEAMPCVGCSRAWCSVASPRVWSA